MPVRTIRIAWSTLVIALAATATVGAQGPAPEPTRLARTFCLQPADYPSTSASINVDEDWFFDLFHTFPKYNEDRNYTLGASVALVSTRFNGEAWCFILQQAMDKFFGFSWPHSHNANSDPAHRREAYGLTAFISAYTPAGVNLKVSTPIPDDRPYSSIEGIATSHLTARGNGFEVGNSALRTELDVALLGMPQAHRAQAWIHSWARPDTMVAPGVVADTLVRPFDPKGWSHQISNGGEPTARFAASWKRLDSENTWFDVSHGFEGSVGYYTGVAATGLARLGVHHTPFHSANISPIGMANQGLSSDTAQSSHDFYAFVGVNERLVAYNALLEGQFRHSDVRVSPANVEREVTEFQTGIAISYRGVALTWAVLTGRTPEFRGPLARVHLWSGLYATLGGS